MDIHLTPEFRKREIQMQIEDGWQAAKRGEVEDGDELFNRIDAELEALERLPMLDRRRAGESRT